MSCAVYYSRVDTAEGKARRMKQWAEGRGAARVMATTKALGMGIDIADVRLVVHAGARRRLRDYAQESGRAGRDGGRSEAVIVHTGQAGGRGGDKASWLDKGMEAFLGPGCGRVVLDRVMDGWTERTGCEEGEEPCDRCAARGAEAGAEAEAAGEGEGEGEAAGTGSGSELQLFVGAQVKARAAERQQAAEARRQGDEVEAFRQLVESWTGCCVVCRVERGEGRDHEMEACPMRGTEEWEMYMEGIEVTEREMFGRRRLERYSGCFFCGLRQELCNTWTGKDDDGGQFEKAQGGGCQDKGVLVGMYVGMMVAHGEAGFAMAKGLAERDGVDRDDVEGWYKWLGRRVGWGGLEAKEVCRVCLYVDGIEQTR